MTSADSVSENPRAALTTAMAEAEQAGKEFIDRYPELLRERGAAIAVSQSFHRAILKPSARPHGRPRRPDVDMATAWRSENPPRTWSSIFRKLRMTAAEDRRRLQNAVTKRQHKKKQPLAISA